MQPIETRYRGYRFRSRLEARWAVFFDALGIPWEYEREGYSLGPIGQIALDDGTTSSWEDDDKYGELPYLPDFWLPAQDCWIEIKGEAPTALEELKAARLAYAMHKDVYLFFGDLPAVLDPQNLSSTGGKGSALLFDVYGEGWDNHYAWCECPGCHALGITYSGYADRLPCGCAERMGLGRICTVGAPRLARAYDRARAARFEHRRKGGRHE